MAFKAIQNPGNVNVRFGAAMQDMEDAIRLKDLPGAADALSTAADYISVFMSSKEWSLYESMPSFAYGDLRSHGELYADLCARRRTILAYAKRAGVFARKPDMEATDADEDDEEQEVVA
jgi:hypothetical protein